MKEALKGLYLILNTEVTIQMLFINLITLVTVGQGLYQASRSSYIKTNYTEIPGEERTDTSQVIYLKYRNCEVTGYVLEVSSTHDTARSVAQ